MIVALGILGNAEDATMIVIMTVQIVMALGIPGNAEDATMIVNIIRSFGNAEDVTMIVIIRVIILIIFGNHEDNRHYASPASPAAMIIIMTTHHCRNGASDAIWVKKIPKKPKPRALFLVARKPQLNPGVGGTGRQPLNNLGALGRVQF